MSEQDSTGVAEVTPKLSDQVKRGSGEESVANGTRGHHGRPRHGSNAWVVCIGVDDSTVCEQAFNCAYWFRLGRQSFAYVLVYTQLLMHQTLDHCFVSEGSRMRNAEEASPVRRPVGVAKFRSCNA